MNDAQGSWALPTAIALLAVTLAIAIDQSAPPVPLGADADRGLFSAERARNELTNLLGDESPHPVGSAANRAVKERLMTRLEELGLTPEEQRTVGCGAEHATCAQVENVLAEIPGKTAESIVLMAHYDSVENAPGAGDDGAGVAALLEVARILEPDAPYRNTLLFVFTDAEEMGLLGAEAFFAEHPAAKRAKAVINLEGSGSSGPAYLLRTGPSSGELMNVFRAVSPHPAAQSFTEEVFERMPNDTDFSVSMRAGLPGIDFAFAGERNHYHTPLDTIANLDLGTLQHHGENTLPLLRALVDADLSVTAPNGVYANLGKQIWLRWAPATGMWLAALAIILLAFATWRIRLAPIRLLAAVGFGFATMILSVVVALGALWLVDRLTGARPAWPADPLPWRIPLYAAPLFALAIIGPFAVRRIGAWSVLLGVWWMWALAAVAMAIFLPLAAYLLIPGALVAGVVAAIAALVRLESAVAIAAAACAALLAAAWFIFPIAYVMESSQGLQLAPAIILPLALTALVTLPTAIADRSRVVLLGALAAFGLSFAMAALVSPYSPNRPQHLTLLHVHDVESKDAYVVAWSPNPLPKRITDLAPFEEVQAVPWSDDKVQSTRVAASIEEAPTLTPLDSVDPKWHRYRITPVAGAHGVALWLPEGRIADAVRIAGHETTTAPNWGDRAFRRITFMAPPPEGFILELEFVGDDPQVAFLADVRGTLPPAARRFSEVRGELAVPVHSGDTAIAYRRIRI